MNRSAAVQRPTIAGSLGVGQGLGAELRRARRNQL
jgi:hypothetical protein